MFRHTYKAAPLAFFCLAALLVSEAAGAPEGDTQNTPPAQAQAQTGDHSYLPPWMQPQTHSGQAGLQSQYLNALDDPALKPKPPQRPRRRHSDPFGGLFW